MKETSGQTASSGSACPRRASGRWDRIAPLLMGLVLMLLAAGLIWAGAGAIRENSWDMPWRSSGGVVLGPLPIVYSSSRTGVEAYRGTAAVRVGIGLSAFGVMLGIWSLSLLWTAAKPRVAVQSSPGAGRGLLPTTLTMVSLACLLAGAIAFFPPWHIGVSAAPTALYTECLLAAILLAIPLTRHRLRRWVLPAATVAAIVAGPFSTGCSVGIILGLFFGLGFAGHVMVLLPKRQSGTDKDRKQ